jgi:hypothetical protein
MNAIIYGARKNATLNTTATTNITMIATIIPRSHPGSLNSLMCIPCLSFVSSYLPENLPVPPSYS